MRMLGKQPAIIDNRVPRMSVVTKGKIPAPPAMMNWYAAVHDWGMLLNDEFGCCVPAAMLHSILQMSTYAANPLIPTNAECEKLYEVTGFDPNNPGATDLGSYVMGPQGLVPYWHTTGIICGGQLNKVDMSMRITQMNPTEWRQAIWLFGGILVGFKIPQKIVDEAPYVWDDPSGPYAGGHEIWLNGYVPASGDIKDATGPSNYDLISWGDRFRVTERFLMGTVDEVVAIINPVEMNVRGFNAADYNLAQLESQMRFLV